MSKATEATEPTGAAPEPPLPDYHAVVHGDVDIAVFVHADGRLSVQARGDGLHVGLYVPAHAVAAFVRAASTPYSGGADR